MKNTITVDHLLKNYGDRVTVNDLSLSVESGTIFGLLGANGAGKTTTIECILGTKKMHAGSVSILGENPQKNRKQLFEKIGVQFQEARYQDKITVQELCELTASLYKSTLDYRDLLIQFEILDKLKSFVGDLSGGERQRLFIVLTFIPNPQVVFLDEVTTGLDVKARRKIWKILEEFKQNGVTIFLTSHFMDEVERLCDKICILKHGKNVFYGTVKEAINRSPYEEFEDAYLWYADEEEENENIYNNA